MSPAAARVVCVRMQLAHLAERTAVLRTRLRLHEEELAHREREGREGRDSGDKGQDAQAFAQLCLGAAPHVGWESEVLYR
jgi:hypothetical protein